LNLKATKKAAQRTVARIMESADLVHKRIVSVSLLAWIRFGSLFRALLTLVKHGSYVRVHDPCAVISNLPSSNLLFFLILGTRAKLGKGSNAFRGATLEMLHYSAETQ
jgi:hypothetical protein